MVRIDVFSEGNVWLSGSKQGWQPRGRWFKSSWGQRCLLVEKWVWGLCEIGDKRLRRCSIFFLTQKKINEKIKKNILWSKTIISRIYCPSFYGHLTIVSMSHDPQKKFFLTRKKIFLPPFFFFFLFFFNFFFQKVIETMVTLCPDLGHGQNP